MRRYVLKQLMASHADLVGDLSSFNNYELNAIGQCVVSHVPAV
jgi:hypothetical protein